RLAVHFVQRGRERGGSGVHGISDEALAVMKAYDWPGNVRELENVIERMSLLHHGDGLLTLADLPAKIRAKAADAGTGASAATPALVPASPPQEPTEPIATVATTPARREAPTPAANGSPLGDVEGTDLVLDPSLFVLPEDGVDLRAAVEA